MSDYDEKDQFLTIEEVTAQTHGYVKPSSTKDFNDMKDYAVNADLLSEELLEDCPFCGDSDVLCEKDKVDFWAQCMNCGARGPAFLLGEYEQGEDVLAWNKGKRESLRHLQVLLDQERDDYNALKDDYERLRNLLDLALCMLDKRDSDLLKKHANMIGVKL